MIDNRIPRRKRARVEREDLRRLPLAAQIARIAKYHRDKIKGQGYCGMGDPFITSDNIHKRFRVVCAEGLLRAYARVCPPSRTGLILTESA